MGCLLKANGLYSRMTTGAVLLAAGRGERLGGRPKALLELGGVPLVMRQLVALSAAGVDELVVVLGHHADRIEPVVRHFPVTLVRNPDPDAGQPTSVRLGLQQLSPRLDAVLIALADQPLIGEADLVALISAFKKRPTGTSMVVPRVGGEPGNPVIVDAALRNEWLAGDATGACRRWRDAHPERVHWFDSDNRRYRIDIDTDEDLRAFAQQTGHELRWPAETTAAP